MPSPTNPVGPVGAVRPAIGVRKVIPAILRHVTMLAPRPNEGRHREASRWCGCRTRSPCQGRSASRGQLGHSLEPRSGSRTRREASVAGLPFYTSEPASDAPLPRSIKLTCADRKRQEETARARVDGRREQPPSPGSQADRLCALQERTIAGVPGRNSDGAGCRAPLWACCAAAASHLPDLLRSRASAPA